MSSAERALMARALTRALQRAPETKRAPLALSAVSEAGVFEGYASLFNVADLGRDVVMPGAFADTLKRRDAAQIKMLWQHDPAEPIGAWLSVTEDARGLAVKGRLNLAVARAREILSLMREGQVDGLSIGFRTQRAVDDRKAGVRRLYRLDLWEISLVTFPMLPQARVTSVKRLECDTIPISRETNRGGGFRAVRVIRRPSVRKEQILQVWMPATRSMNSTVRYVECWDRRYLVRNAGPAPPIDSQLVLAGARLCR